MRKPGKIYTDILFSSFRQHSSVTNNMADGVKVHVHDQRPASRVVEGLDVHDFCTYSTTHSQGRKFMSCCRCQELSQFDFLASD